MQSDYLEGYTDGLKQGRAEVAMSAVVLIFIGAVILATWWFS